MADQFDVVILGAGPGGEACAQRLAEAELSVAVIECELVGGECPYWACVPSKTLLRGPEVRAQARRIQGLGRPELNWPEARAYRDYMVQELDDSDKSSALEEQGITLIRGRGQLAGAGVIAAGERRLEARHVVIATGSTAAIPSIDGLEDVPFWTNREAYTVKELPVDAIVLGGGPVGLETAQMLSRYGCEVTLVEPADALLGDEEPRAGELIERLLSEEGIEIRVGVEPSTIRAEGARVSLELEGGEIVEGERVIVATGRDPRSRGIGLESVGIELAEDGSIPIDERCQAAENVWAVGDVTAVAPLTHVAHYQGRLVADAILGKTMKAEYGAIPRAVFTDPEVAAVGLTGTQAQEQGIDVARGSVELDVLARSEMFGVGVEGFMCLIADRRREVLVGAHAVGPMASEWIHAPTLAIALETPVGSMRELPQQFPTFSEAFGYALRDLPAEIGAR